MSKTQGRLRARVPHARVPRFLHAAKSFMIINHWGRIRFTSDHIPKCYPFGFSSNRRSTKESEVQYSIQDPAVPAVSVRLCKIIFYFTFTSCILAILLIECWRFNAISASQAIITIRKLNYITMFSICHLLYTELRKELYSSRHRSYFTSM